MLEAGMKAPDFTLEDKDGNLVSLHDFAGKKVVVYFTRKILRRAVLARPALSAIITANIKRLGVEVIGISKDSVKSHSNFAAKQELPFILLSDPERKAIEAFGVWQEKKMYGKVSMGVVRSTFVIDENGVVEKVYPKAKPDTNAEEILAYLKG